MNTLCDHIQEYQKQLNKGHIQKAYAGIMAFMSSEKSYLTDKYPEFSTSSLYFGYMDMTYFAFTPIHLKEKKLKIAIVFLHEACRFEAWLAGSNRKIQTEVINQLSEKNLGKYQLSSVSPGIDSIIDSVLVEKPDFDKPDALRYQIEEKTIEFIEDMTLLVNQLP